MISNVCPLQVSSNEDLSLKILTDASMSNRTRKRERFPIGEWSRPVKNKRDILVQANESLQNIQNQVDYANDKYEKLKESNAILEGKVNDLIRKVIFTIEFNKVYTLLFLYCYSVFLWHNSIPKF